MGFLSYGAAVVASSCKWKTVEALPIPSAAKAAGELGTTPRRHPAESAGPLVITSLRETGAGADFRSTTGGSDNCTS